MSGRHFICPRLLKTDKIVRLVAICDSDLVVMYLESGQWSPYGRVSVVGILDTGTFGTYSVYMGSRIWYIGTFRTYIGYVGDLGHRDIRDMGMYGIWDLGHWDIRDMGI